MKKLIDQIMKFGVVGFIAFFIDFGIFKLLSGVFGVYYLIANFFGFTISLIFNYIASMTFVFERKENIDKRKEFVVFTILSVIGLILNELIIYTCIEGIYFITRKIFLEKKE